MSHSKSVTSEEVLLVVISDIATQCQEAIKVDFDLQLLLKVPDRAHTLEVIGSDLGLESIERAAATVIAEAVSNNVLAHDWQYIVANIPHLTSLVEAQVEARLWSWGTAIVSLSVTKIILDPEMQKIVNNSRLAFDAISEGLTQVFFSLYANLICRGNTIKISLAVFLATSLLRLHLVLLSLPLVIEICHRLSSQRAWNQ
jgi:hypothetical protein